MATERPFRPGASKKAASSGSRTPRRDAEPASVFVDRRRRDASGRRAEFVVIELAKWLPPPDLAMLNWIYHSKRPSTELARARGEPVWVLRRRLRRLVTRVLSTEFCHVARKLEATPMPPVWPPTNDDLRNYARLNLAIGRAVYIDGIKMRQAAIDADLPLHTIRRHCDAILLEVSANKQLGS